MYWYPKSNDRSWLYPFPVRCRLGGDGYPTDAIASKPAPTDRCHSTNPTHPANPLSCHNPLRPSDRQMHTKGIHPMVTAHEHIPAMHQGNRLDDGQPQPVVVAAVGA